MPKRNAPFSSERLLGIETGGTHTAVLLVDGADHSPVHFDIGPANLRLISDSDLKSLLREIRARTGSVDAVGAGVAGLRNARDRARFLRIARGVWPQVPVAAADDLASAMMAAGPLPEDVKARVLLLSGTGSCAYGKCRDGRSVKFGGRGHILGDQGSACDIALAALRRIVYQHDVAGKFPALGKVVLRAAQLNEPDDLIPWTMEARKEELAQLAVTIFQEQQRDDPIAREVVRGAVHKLADMALHCAEHLLPHRGRVQFVFAGGVLLKQAAFAEAVRRRIHAHWQHAEVVRLRRASVWGAVELARETAAGGMRKIAANGEIPAQTETVALASLAESPTEQRNPKSLKLDTMPLSRAIGLMLREDAAVPRAIFRVKNAILWLLREVIAAFKRGGRLFYVGAGTSGRLGILDASECPPTFRVSPDQVQGIIAGGRSAIWSAVEGAEDDYDGGAAAARYRGVRKSDVMLGIAASGRTPFVWGALHEAKKIGAVTALLCFNPTLKVPRDRRPDKMILINTGPEILTGSTRLKAGTATKLVLNILTTLAMVHTGKVISNLMIDLHPTNSKLRDRAVRLLCDLTGCTGDAARAALEASDWVVKDAHARCTQKRSRTARNQTGDGPA